MESTRTSTATSTLLSTGTGTAAGRLVLPAAVDAPAALVIAVDVPFAQETSALVQLLPVDGSVDVDRHASARNAVQVPPPRGTPV